MFPSYKMLVVSSKVQGRSTAFLFNYFFFTFYWLYVMMRGAHHFHYFNLGYELLDLDLNCVVRKHVISISEETRKTVRHGLYSQCWINHCGLKEEVMKKPSSIPKSFFVYKFFCLHCLVFLSFLKNVNGVFWNYMIQFSFLRGSVNLMVLWKLHPYSLMEQLKYW